MNKKLLLLFFAIATCGIMVNAATNYNINVGGVEVTSDNASHITGGDIKNGYGVYNASTNTLTLYNIYIYRTGVDNYGIHNRKCDNLTIVFNGGGTIATSDNALKLERSTTLNASSGCKVDFITAARICANLKSYNYYIKGSGEFNFQSGLSGYEAIKGEGIGSTKVYFQGAKVTASSEDRSAISSFSAYFYSGSYLKISPNGSDASVSNVAMEFYGKEAVISPHGAVYHHNSVYWGATSYDPVTNLNILISDDYVAIVNNSYFPDLNFEQEMYYYFPKGYITSSDVASMTTLNVSGKNISSLTGIEIFDQLKTFDCSNNHLTSLSSLPNSIETLACGSNDFTSLSLNNQSKLEVLNCVNNLNMSTLTCCNNALRTLQVSGCSAMTKLLCYNNKITSLNLNGCTKLNELDCNANQITTISNIPTSLQKLLCYNNKLSGSLDLSNRGNLKTLQCYNNPNLSEIDVRFSDNLEVLDAHDCTNLTYLNCQGYSSSSPGKLTSLNLSGLTNLSTLYCNNLKLSSLNLAPCTKLTYLECSNNQLTSLSGIPNTIKTINCSNNKLTYLNIVEKPALYAFDCSNNKSLTQLYVYHNALTSLNVVGCSALTTLYCNGNKLTSLSVSGCSSLNKITIAKNKINGSGMQTLVNSLRTIPSSESEGIFMVYNQDIGSEEGNGITTAQVNTARGKRWKPQKYMNGAWVDIVTSIPGDVNGDGHVSSVDVTALYNWLLNNDGSAVINGDQDGDGHITSGDITVVYNLMLGN